MMASPDLKKPIARKAALSAALKALEGGKVREEIAAIKMERHDRALATRIATGSLKRHITLNNLYTAISRKKHIPDNIREIFRQAAYQMLFMHVEPSVAIDAAVRLSKVTGPNIARVVNGLLREVSNLKPERRPGNPTFDELRRSIHLATDEGGPGHLYFARRLVRRDPRGDLEHASSLPANLAWRWYKTLGEEAFWQFADWANSAPYLTVRVNRLKLREGETIPGLFPENAKPLVGEGIPPDVYVLPDAPVEEVPGIISGLLLTQDVTNMLPVEALGIEPGMNVLDVCAAPGGKTIQAAEKLNGKGRLVAVEFIPGRADALKANLEHAGAAKIEVVIADAKNLPAEYEGCFDRVIVDVPCTNTGQLSRRPEVRLRVTKESIERLSVEQKAILHSSIRALRPGGKLVYSTCSLEPEENEAVVHSLKDAAILQERLTWPVLHTRDGGYFAVLAKKG
jgi:16S rRNA (cytosine967-C5)-methyltransferase